MWMTMKSGWLREGVALFLAATMVFFGAAPAVAQEVPGTLNNSGLIPFDQAFFAFEVESPLGTLKEVPDLGRDRADAGQSLPVRARSDRGGEPPGLAVLPLDPAAPPVLHLSGTAAGQPCAPGSAGCTEVPLPRHVIHPLNYNHSTGEELRLLNPEFEGLACPDPRGGGRTAGRSRIISSPSPTAPTSDAIGTSRSVRARNESRRTRRRPTSTARSRRIPTTCIRPVDQFFVRGPTPQFSAGPASGGTAIPEGLDRLRRRSGRAGLCRFGVLSGALEDSGRPIFDAGRPRRRTGRRSTS